MARSGNVEWLAVCGALVLSALVFVAATAATILTLATAP